MLISVFLFILITSLFGWHFDVVPTKSMEPAINPGGMVVTRPAEVKGIAAGDIVLFKDLNVEAYVCHRVIDIKEIDGQLFFQTKGDANEYPDSDMVSSQNFIGKTIFYVPHIGNIAFHSHLHESPIVFMGKKISLAMLFIVVICLIVIGTELKNILEWILDPHSKRRQKVLKKRRHRLKAKRRRGRILAG